LHLNTDLGGFSSPARVIFRGSGLFWRLCRAKCRDPAPRL